MREDTVTYDKSVILNILRDLDLLVVSTDRIGSAYYDYESDRQYNADFLSFFDEFGFSKKLASARRALEEPFSTKVDEDGMYELERNAKGLKYWGDK